jgi:hypothetical protein
MDHASADLLHLTRHLELRQIKGQHHTPSYDELSGTPLALFLIN